MNEFDKYIKENLKKSDFKISDDLKEQIEKTLLDLPPKNSRALSRVPVSAHFSISALKMPVNLAVRSSAAAGSVKGSSRISTIRNFGCCSVLLKL